MKTIWVIQHTQAEYLGLIEDHLEGRNLRFRYFRPFVAGGSLPEGTAADGLILLGAGPYGVVSGHILPSLGPELRLAQAFLHAGKPVVGFGLGALILAVAGGGGAEEAPLRFEVAGAEITGLGPAAPQRMPLACYLRDRPVLGPGMAPVMTGSVGELLGFTVGENSLGLLGHPGMKRGMAEDLIMEFSETPEATVEALDALGMAQREIAESLGPFMVALIAQTGWMSPSATQR
ncbi:GMP synthase-like glutamine amidotransferase [Rhodobacter sp. JA431]|uniref:GMP synthase n=1 Tax=Rhodobacter sp. JA431 TaxID=570013 RepID=UPI000BD9DF0E|nr:GMP synthase [Rhodobacter sp. JA431]SOC03779.1 GMP synthase-like glutamine amidotransferase [Rhodobacter sp. JA431]